MVRERRNLIVARQNMKLTQGEVAERANISRTFYVHIEKGRRSPSLAVAFRIAEVLGKQVGDIFRDNSVPN